MEFNESCQKIIPGYINGSDIANEFEASEIGREFYNLAHNHYINMLVIEQKYSTIFSFLYAADKAKEQLIVDWQFNDARTPFLQRAGVDEHYQLCVGRIIQPALLTQIEDLKYLSSQEQLDVAIALSTTEQENWLSFFNETEILKPLRDKISNARLAAEQAAILDNRQHKSDYIQRFIDKIQNFDAFSSGSNWPVNCADIIDDETLSIDNDLFNQGFKNIVTELVHHFLDDLLQQNPELINASSVNSKYFNELPELLINNFQGELAAPITHWQQRFKTELLQFILKDLKKINNKVWRPFSHIEFQNFTQSLSSLFLKNKTVKNTAAFMNKVANAHAFIQATSLATQNENSYLAMIDVYNYFRFYDVIDDKREIVASILSPFNPIYFEYKNIAAHEKNIYKTIIGIVMPVIVAVAFTILVASLLSSLVIGEAAFIIALIPTIYLGLCVAAEYVKYKNYIISNLNVFWYNGPFEIPQFQVNERLKVIFPESDNINAEQIRQLYINELKKCDELEQELAPQAKLGVLSSDKLDERKANLKLRHALILEWYDVHSNNELGCELVRELVKNRVQAIESTLYQRFSEALDKDAVSLKESVDGFVENATAVLATEEPLGSDIGDSNRHYSAGFFQPARALEIKQEVVDMDNFRLAL